MIKLKLNKDELHSLCWFCSPAINEERAVQLMYRGYMSEIDTLFNMIEIGVKLSKKYLYETRKSYNIKLSYSEASSLLSMCNRQQNGDFSGTYNDNVILRISIELNKQLTKYARRFDNQFSRAIQKQH